MLLENLVLLGGILTIIAVLGVVLAGGFVGFRVLRWHLARRREESRSRRRRTGADGVPLPRAGRGLCDSCARVRDAVYHLPDGHRRCEECLSAAAAR